MTKHSFGGPWTYIKLELLERYLTFFNTALQRRPTPESPFSRVYIDAFAGTGECEIKLPNGTLSTIRGSARIAIETSPAFNQVHLIDLKAKHVAELQALAASQAQTTVIVHKQDANLALQAILSKLNWRNTRGVLFLDPYGMHVQWSTLERIAATRALDVWYLFPLSGVYRQAAKDFTKVDESKAASLDSVLGTTTWRQAFYEQPAQRSCLEDNGPAIRTSGPAQIATFVHTRLSELFKGWVSEPIFLPENGPPIFALFFAVSNPSDVAITLSKKGADHLFSMLKNKKIGKSLNSIEHNQKNLF
ncbi:three-Cys-motif partner protein TcmP [Pseudoduganella violacea]|uniref:Three-Cys-motif partner protein n=1 Tax=Pseudoduganella violacea TaxID=1715466 RepID=A0A7W5FTU3_9BURK|nr:three-Cys-motif partner protein TcmP [Pseudoduganella violacea]MBB3119017.1 three-Cys-motif partner protein [Pseudoduganella violacea]